MCVAAPPSDQDEKTYDKPPIVCGVTALIEFAEPITTVFVSGAAPAVLLIDSEAPVGFEASVTFTVRGLRRTFVVALRPFESVAVSWSSSQQGYS